MKLVAVDIGGTHARFAVAEVENGNIVLGEALTLKTADFDDFASAWAHFASHAPVPLPRVASIAVAASVSGDVIQLTNNCWTIERGSIRELLDLDDYLLLNDFGAVAHTVGLSSPDSFLHLCGPDIPLPQNGTISIVGPGTGLGIAHIRRLGGKYHIQATVGGHMDFAPVDTVEDHLLSRLRLRFGRVSVERVVSGPGLVTIYQTLADLEGCAVEEQDDQTLWARGITGEDRLAAQAIKRFCMSLGSVAGDIALAHGASGIVIAGGLGLRIRDTLLASNFGTRFRAKGRYEGHMAGLPVKLITRDQPGLYGAAAAFAMEHL